MKIYLLFVIALLMPLCSYGADLESTVRDAFELYSVNNFTEAAPMFEEAYYMAKKNTPKDISSRFRTSLYAGLSYRGMNEFQQAAAWFSISLALAEKVNDLYDVPTLLAYIAEAERMSGNAKKAEEYYAKALLYDGLTDKDKAVLYYGIAESSRIEEDYTGSKKSCDEALKYAANLKLFKIMSSCDIIYGEYYRVNKDYSKAMYYFTRAHDAARAKKYTDILVPALNGMGLTSEALHRSDAAREYFEQALFAAVENEAFDNADIIYKKIVNYMPEKGSFKYQGDKALELASPDFLDEGTSLLLYSLSALYYRTSEMYKDLYPVAETGYNIAVKSGKQNEVGEFLYDMALSLLKSNEYEECSARSEEAISRIKSTETKYLLKEAYLVQSDCLYNLGNYKQAYSAAEHALTYAKVSEHDEINTKMAKIKEKLSGSYIAE